VTPQRRRAPRAKKKNRPTTSPREAKGKESKPITARARPAREPGSASTARPSAARPATRGASGGQPATVVTAPALGAGATRPALPPAEPTLLERAERLRDDVLRSKLTHPDPWTYTAKARAWGERAQALVEEIAVTDQTPPLHAAVAELAAEVEGDADFQKARQLF
jgi:hypothetical protein